MPRITGFDFYKYAGDDYNAWRLLQDSRYHLTTATKTGQIIDVQLIDGLIVLTLKNDGPNWAHTMSLQNFAGAYVLDLEDETYLTIKTWIDNKAKIEEFNTKLKSIRDSTKSEVDRLHSLLFEYESKVSSWSSTNLIYSRFCPDVSNLVHQPLDMDGVDSSSEQDINLIIVESSENEIRSASDLSFSEDESGISSVQDNDDNQSTEIHFAQGETINYIGQSDSELSSEQSVGVITGTAFVPTAIAVASVNDDSGEIDLNVVLVNDLHSADHSQVIDSHVAPDNDSQAADNSDVIESHVVQDNDSQVADNSRNIDIGTIDISIDEPFELIVALNNSELEVVESSGTAMQPSFNLIEIDNTDSRVNIDQLGASDSNNVADEHESKTGISVSIDDESMLQPSIGSFVTDTDKNKDSNISSNDLTASSSVGKIKSFFSKIVSFFK